MNSRERVRRALNHQEPDRVPIDLGGYQTGIMVYAYNMVKEMLGVEEKTEIVEMIQQLAKPCEQILRTFNIDTRYIYFRNEDHWCPDRRPDGSNVGYLEWGNGEMIKKPGCYYYENANFPLADMREEDLDRFQYWPDLNNSNRTEGLKEKVLNLYENTDYAICAALGSAVHEQAWFLTGIDKFLMGLIDNKKFINRLLDKVLGVKLNLYGKFLDITGRYLDVIQLFGDLGSQNGPLFSPSLYRETIKPFDKKLIEMIKSKTSGKILFHTDGDSYEFIPDLIEIGVDILNPVQVSAKNMNPLKLKKEFGKYLCFWGGIDTQKILPYGSSEAVEEEVRKRIIEFSSGGGYILSSVHNIQVDVPPDNVIAMFKSALKYGSNKI